MNYQEKARELVAQSSVAAMVLMGSDITDIELVPLTPRPATEEMLEDLKVIWPGRGLRSVGCIGLCDGAPGFALKEILTQEQLYALTAAFIVYLRVLSELDAEQQKGDAVDWLCRLWRLEDTRPEA